MDRDEHHTDARVRALLTRLDGVAWLRPLCAPDDDALHAAAARFDDALAAVGDELPETRAVRMPDGHAVAAQWSRWCEATTDRDTLHIRALGNAVGTAARRLDASARPAHVTAWHRALDAALDAARARAPWRSEWHGSLPVDHLARNALRWILAHHGRALAPSPWEPLLDLWCDGAWCAWTPDATLAVWTPDAPVEHLAPGERSALPDALATMDARMTALGLGPPPVCDARVPRMSGVCVLDEVETRFEVCAWELTVGRALSNTVVLDDARIAKRHVRVHWRDGAPWITGLASACGTVVSEAAVGRAVRWGFGVEARVGALRVRLDDGQ